MHANQATYANAPIAEASREIPDRLRHLQDAIGELGRRSDILFARVESVRRSPTPAPAGSTDSYSVAPARAPAQTPIGSILDQMNREVESQIRAVNLVIESVELA